MKAEWMYCDLLESFTLFGDVKICIALRRQSLLSIRLPCLWFSSMLLTTTFQYLDSSRRGHRWMWQHSLMCPRRLVTAYQYRNKIRST